METWLSKVEDPQQRGPVAQAIPTAADVPWEEEAVSDKRGIAVHCSLCLKRKKPIGRSAPLEMANGLCDDDCWGYREDPRPGSLWPGELQSEFGFSVGDDATEPVEEKP